MIPIDSDPLPANSRGRAAIDDLRRRELELRVEKLELELKILRDLVRDHWTAIETLGRLIGSMTPPNPDLGPRS